MHHRFCVGNPSVPTTVLDALRPTHPRSHSTSAGSKRCRRADSPGYRPFSCEQVHDQQRRPEDKEEEERQRFERRHRERGQRERRLRLQAEADLYDLETAHPGWPGWACPGRP